MQPLDLAQYQSWRANAEILEKDRYGEKVLRLADGTFLKLFRRKRWLSKSTFYPPAKRFAGNATKLKLLGIPCPTVIQLYVMQAPYRSIVHYDPLPGKTLRQLFKDGALIDQAQMLSRLTVFISYLHDKGVYFRSLHLGNIVLTPSNELGLIDISDMRCLDKPLPQSMRNRNYKHLARYQDEWNLLQRLGSIS